MFNRAPFFRMLPVLLPTLLLLASKKVAALAEGRVQTILNGLPAQVAEEVVSHMSALELSEFVTSEGGILNIKKKFTTSGFQKFFMRFMFVYDSRDVHVSVKLQLMKQLRTFQDAYNENFNLDQDMFCDIPYVHDHVSHDWSLLSMGCFYKFGPSANQQVSFEMEFFRCKFWKKQYTIRFPIPVLPKDWILPEYVDTDKLHLPMIDTVHETFAEPDCVRTCFFMRLVGMTEAFSKYRQHETLAYGFELISRNDFFNYPNIYKYYLYIYAMLAVTLAQINVQHMWPMTFMNKAKQFLVHHSQQLDIWHYEQIMYGEFNATKNANQAFEKLFSILPSNSLFYIACFCTRQKYFEFRLETILFKILCYQHATEQTQECRDLKMKFIRLAEYYVDCQKEFIHHCLSIKQNMEKNIKVGLAICDMYQVCIDILKKGYKPVSSDKLMYIAFQLGETQNFRNLFFYYHAQPHMYPVTGFVARMNKLQDKVKELTHFINHEEYATCCFSYFLMFHIIANDPRQALPYFEECHTIFKKCNSKYAELCNQFAKKTANFSEKEITIQDIQCDVKLLLSKEPKVAEYCKLGIISLQQADNRK
jgi:hypothetical protein